MNETFRIFEDSAPFSLVINRASAETSSEQQAFQRGPRFHIGCGGRWRFQPLEPETKCEGKALEVTMALWNVEQESWCFGTVSETRRTQHRERQFGQNPLPTKCLLPGEIVSKLLSATERKRPKHVRQKQLRTGTVLALSSPFVNRET